jgi:hypothetical protein
MSPIIKLSNPPQVKKHKPVPAGRHWKSLEHGSSFLAGNVPDFFPMISGQFLKETTGSWQESTGKNSDNFRPEYCFHVSAISSVFLQDTVTFPHLSCRILQDRWPEPST